MLEEKLEQIGQAMNRRLNIPYVITRPITTFLYRGRKRQAIRAASVIDYDTKVINEAEIVRCYRNAIQYLIKQIGSANIGDYLEFGVYHGTSMMCIYDELQKAGLSNVRLFGFDSFEGLPPCDEGCWMEGSYNSDYDYTKKLLTEHGIDWNRAELIKGWFNKMLNDNVIKTYNINKASLIMVDCDLYSSARDSLQFVGPLIKDHSVIFF